MLVERLIAELNSELKDTYKLDDCDIMLVVRGYVRGALNEARNPALNKEELSNIREKWGI